jgi:uncharacterized protein (DUF2336 family)
MASAITEIMQLVELAKGGSGDKRRELLRQITDVFLADPKKHSETEMMLFDEIIVVVSAGLDKQVRMDLARKVLGAKAALRRTTRQLAMDEIEVAHPVIERSGVLSETDMLDVIAQTSQAHMMAITLRPDIGETVSGALVEKGSEAVVAALLENQTARIGRQTFERIAARAEKSRALHAPFVRNAEAPLELLYKVYLQVETDLRREIMRKFYGASPAGLEAAIAASRSQLPFAYLDLPQDYQAAKDHVAGLEQRGGLKPPVLVQLLREERRTAFLIAFTRLVDIDFDLGRKLIEDKDVDGVALACRAAKFDKGLFVSTLLLSGVGSGGLSRADVYGRHYEQIPVASAQRALGFWKVRAKGVKAA